MSHEGPVAESAVAAVAVLPAPLSPKTSAARFVTSDSLTRAVSVAGVDLVGVSARAPVSADWVIVPAVRGPSALETGAGAAGSGARRGAGACVHAANVAATAISRILFTTLLQRGLERRPHSSSERKRHSRCFGRLLHRVAQTLVERRVAVYRPDANWMARHSSRWTTRMNGPTVSRGSCPVIGWSH